MVTHAYYPLYKGEEFSLETIYCNVVHGEEEELVEEVAEENAQETTTTTAAPKAGSKRPPGSPQPGGRTNPSAGSEKTAKSKGKGVKGLAKKFAGAVTKGGKKALKATKGAANTMKKKIVKKNKTAYMELTPQTPGPMNINEPLTKTLTFKYLGSSLSYEGGATLMCELRYRQPGKNGKL
ncbi:hypothetical protein D918_04913 [Trichuris suis]|nr:hypothetical protein D918_04913 [Trichuris suis]